MKYLIILLLSSFILTIKVSAQSNQHSGVLDASGGSFNVGSTQFDFTFGETMLTQTFYLNTGPILAQGFLQPSSMFLPIGKNLLAYSNVITPNGDGKNDFFTIVGLEEYPVHTLSILNRWGNQVYLSKGTYNNDWYGLGLSDGTYFFVIEFKGKDGVTHNQNGFITLIKGR